MAAPPLEAELRTMLATERRVLRQLSIAYTGISRDLTRLEKKHGPGAMVERAQLREMRAAISTQMAGMWRAVGNEIRAGRIEAGGAAGARLGEALDVFRSAGLSAAEVAGMKATMEASARAGVEAALKRVQGRSYIPLSERVYATSVAADSRLQDVINTELLKGANWQRMAKAVREHIRPDVAGGVPYAAKRLARTEINNAFHATTLDKMRAEPFVDYVQWELSGSHKRPDVCNEYAETAHTKTGEPGVYRNGDTPERPHPQCLCFVSAVDIGVDEFLRRFKDGEMDKWLADEGFEIEDLGAAKEAAGPAITGTPAAAPRALNPVKMTETMRKQLTVSTSEAVKDYTGQGYEPLARFLRGSQTAKDWRFHQLSQAEQNARFAKMVDDMDEAFAAAKPLADDVVLLRGEQIVKGGYNPGEHYKVGEYVVSPTYTSTTTKKAVADRFVSPTSRVQGWAVEVRVPKGTKAIRGAEHEGEIILPRNSKFKVVSKTPNSRGGGKIVLELEPELVTAAPRPALKPLVEAAQDLKYTDAEKRAIHSYSLAAYDNINSGLRGLEPIRPRAQGFIEELDKAMAKSKLDREVITYRGVDPDTFSRSQLVPGTEIEDKAFMSTSFDYDRTKHFLYNYDFGDASATRGGVIFRIRVPEGTRAVNIGEEEAELLLDRGSKLRIDAVNENRDGVLEVDVTVEQRRG